MEAKNIVRYVVVEEKEVMDFFISCLKNPPQIWDYFHDAVCKKIVLQSTLGGAKDLVYTTFKEYEIIKLFINTWNIPGYSINKWESMFDIGRCVYVFTLYLKKEGSNHD